LGRINSEEARKKISNHNKGRFLGAKSVNAKKVYCYNFDGDFVKCYDSISDVEREVREKQNIKSKRKGCVVVGVRICCAKNKNKDNIKTFTAYGFVWFFDYQGEKIINKGTGCTKETRIKMSESMKKTLSVKFPKKIKKLKPRPSGGRNGNAKKVKQYGLDGNLLKIWDCIMDACRELKISRSNIHATCNGKYKTANGFVWRYLNDEF
jgi:hypothetical protein